MYTKIKLKTNKSWIQDKQSVILSPPNKGISRNDREVALITI